MAAAAAGGAAAADARRSKAPLVRLTAGLVGTYRAINAAFYAKRGTKRRAGDADGVGEPEALRAARRTRAGPGADAVVRGDVLNDRYEVVADVGAGSFGRVVRCTDLRTGRSVAVKLVREHEPSCAQARREARLLTELDERLAPGRERVVRLLDTFVLERPAPLPPVPAGPARAVAGAAASADSAARGSGVRFQCLVLELLGDSLYDLLHSTGFQGVSIAVVRDVAAQVLQALAFLRDDSGGGAPVVHADLKPENLLLCEPRCASVKLIDFGSSCHADETGHTYVQSRFYRSPEVLLGLPYGPAIDVWSLGCLLAEMHSGEPLFSGVDEHDQLRRITELRGPVSPAVLRRALPARRRRFFTRAGALRPVPWAAEEPPRPKRTLRSAVAAAAARHVSQRRPAGPAWALAHAETQPGEMDAFVSLLESLLAYSPEARPTPREALAHPFFSGDSGPPPTMTPSPRSPVTPCRSPHSLEDDDAAGCVTALSPC